MTERIYLVGFMGAGKTRLGRRLAESLGWEFLDTDEELERRSGRTIAAWFAGPGEAAFRREEISVLERVAARRGRVIATGGGLFCRAEARRRIRASGTSLWLDVPLERIRERIGTGTGRPLWQAGDPVALRALYERRRACYALADRRYRPCRRDAEPDLRTILAGIGPHRR